MDVEEYLHASTPVATTAVIKKKRMSTMTKDVGLRLIGLSLILVSMKNPMYNQSLM
jgi:hypothetical protein